MKAKAAIAALAELYVPVIFQRILRALEASPHTSRTLSQTIHSHQSNITTHLQKLNRLQLIHIAKWERNSRGPFVPWYIIGPGLNASKPRPLTSAEKSKAWRRRGNDSHKSRHLATQAKKIHPTPTLANLLIKE